MIKNNPKLKKYGLTPEDLAHIFNYSSVGSFYSSRGRDKLVSSVESIISLVEKHILDRLNE